MTSSQSDIVDLVARTSAMKQACAAMAERIEVDALDLRDAYLALEIELLTLCAMCTRSDRTGLATLAPRLPASALSLKADEVDQQLRELMVKVAGYRALPAPDEQRSHNLEPLAEPCEAAAVDALLELHQRNDGYRFRADLAEQLYPDCTVSGRSTQENAT